MCHYPMLTWNRRPHGTCHIHAHSHGSLDEFNELSKELRFDIGFDSKVGNLNFVPLEVVYNKMITIRNKTNNDMYVLGDILK